MWSIQLGLSTGLLGCKAWVAETTLVLPRWSRTDQDDFISAETPFGNPVIQYKNFPQKLKRQDVVLRRVLKDGVTNKLTPNWEGSFKIVEEVGKGACCNYLLVVHVLFYTHFVLCFFSIPNPQWLDTVPHNT
ncbi:hypothetical protein CR513_47745, partial [Mucuna pruriens]